MIWNIEVYTDMGHLMTRPEYGIPRNIHRFVFEKIKLYANCATDKELGQCRFYILKPEMEKKWTYFCDGDIVNIFYNLNEFNPDKMVFL